MANIIIDAPNRRQMEVSTSIHDEGGLAAIDEAITTVSESTAVIRLSP